MDGATLKDRGDSAERIAEDFLQKQGFEILAVNYRFGRYGEIDIVAHRDGLVVFAEVKSRETDKFGGGRYAVSRKKMRSLQTTARHFIAHRFNDRDRLYRFDLIAIENGTVHWIEDIAR